MDKLKNFLVNNRKKLILAIIVLFFIIILAASIYYITIDDGVYKKDDWSSTPFAVSTYTQGAKIGENGIEFDTTPQELWNKMMQNGSNVSRYLSSPEELEKLMQAEIVTQYPKVGVTDSNKLDGIVEFKREDSNSNVTNLKYVKESTFDSYIENYKNSGDITALNYFSIDDNGNVLMAQWTETTTTTTTKDQNGNTLSENTNVVYSMVKTPINYKSVVLKYSMPFDYLWALLVVSDSKDFVLELADFILEDSQIQITGHENLNESTDIQEEQNEVQIQVEVTDPQTGEKKTETKTQTQTTEIKTAIKSTTITPEVTKADTWIYSSTDTGGSELNSKLDPESDERNFMTIFNSYSIARRNITRYADWLFDILESNDSTANMVDLTKYWLYIAVYENNNFSNVGNLGSSDLLVRFVHHFEHSTLPPTNADGTKYIIENDGAGNPVVGYGVDIYNSGYLSLFQAAGYPTNIGGEVDKDFVDSLEKMAFEDKTKSIKSSLSGLELTDYQLNALISRAYNCGVSGAVGIRNGKNFVQAYNTYWNQDTDDYFESKKNNANFSHQLYTQYMKDPTTSKGQYLRGLEIRRKSEWTLFQTGYYDVLNEWHSDVDGGSIIEIAKNIHEYMEKNNYTYCVYGGNSYEECSGGTPHGLNKTFEQSKTGFHHSCCATYVSWVLQEAGYISDGEHLDGANNLQALLKGKGFKIINNQSDLEAGDILCYNSHVEIYAGNNTIYNAGSGKAIRSSSPQRRTRSFNYALRAPN